MKLPVIKKGIATVATIITGLIALIPPLATVIIDDIENVQVHWGEANKTALISGAALVAVGAFGRFAQAVAHIWSSYKVGSGDHKVEV